MGTEYGRNSDGRTSEDRANGAKSSGKSHSMANKKQMSHEHINEDNYDSSQDGRQTSKENNGQERLIASQLEVYSINAQYH